MGHNRKLVIGGVDLVKVHLKNTLSVASEIRDELENEIIQMGWFPNEHFNWVGLIWRYGVKTDIKPEIKKVNRKYRDLPVSIEIDATKLQELDQDIVRIKEYLKSITINCLFSVGLQYDLPVSKFQVDQ
jgi:hypothetical protein